MWRKVVAIVGACVAALGAVLGFLPMTADGNSCGSGFRRDYWGGDTCDTLTAAVRVPATALLVVGLAMVAVAAVAYVASRQDLRSV